MEIKYDKEGLQYPFKGRYLTILGCGVAQGLSDIDIKNFAKHFIDFKQKTSTLPITNIKLNDFILEKKLEKNNLLIKQPFIKYISKSDYDNFYSKGQFQFGTSKYYRTIEKEKSRDGFEGFNFTFLCINEYNVPIVFFRANNYLILCGSYEQNSKYLKDKFGEVEMKIDNTVGFCEEIQKTIGAKSFFIGKIQYSNARIYKSKQINIPNFNATARPHEFLNNSEILELLEDTSVLPSLFVKPETFKDEHELRIVFEMQKDFDGSFSFEDKNLLKFIKFNV